MNRWSDYMWNLHLKPYWLKLTETKSDIVAGKTDFADWIEPNCRWGLDVMNLIYYSFIEKSRMSDCVE